MSTLNVEGIKNAAASSDAITLVADGTATAKLTNRLNRNLITNGDMRINQRYGTSSSTEKDRVTVDRWRESNPGASGMSHQTVTDGPPGFEYSEKMTMGSSAYSTGSTNSMFFQQTIEALDCAHLQLGTSGAKKYTLSFWVKASIAGTYSLASGNTSSGGWTGSGNTTRSFITTYTVSQANTWEYKTITFTGDTSGTWNRNDTNGGLSIIFDLGSGSAHEGTAGQWNSGDNFRVQNSVLMGPTANSTWQITGVQLEDSDYATEFEHRNYSEELLRCQRYYEVVRMSTGTAMFHAAGNSTIGFVSHWWFKADKRIGTPTITVKGTASFKLDNMNAVTLTGMFTAPDHVMFYNANANGGSFRLFDTSQAICISAAAELS